VLENVEMSPNHLLHMIVALHSLAASGAAFNLPKMLRLAYPQTNHPFLSLKFALLYLPVQAKS
jgi:hypothetical protein